MARRTSQKKIMDFHRKETLRLKLDFGNKNFKQALLLSRMLYSYYICIIGEETQKKIQIWPSFGHKQMISKIKSGRKSIKVITHVSSDVCSKISVPV